jgi:hypothetical protein
MVAMQLILFSCQHNQHQATDVNYRTEGHRLTGRISYGIVELLATRQLVLS